MNLILILTFFVFKIVGVHSKWKYEFGKETCPTSDFPCENIFKLGKINKCNGLVFCYPSLLSNPYLFGYNTKFNNRFAFKEGNNSRICTRFIKKEKVQSPEGIKTVWSGFRLFYNNKKNELEVNLDIVGERETIYLTNITIPDFLQAISSKKGAEPTWAKIKEQSYNDKEFIKVIKEGAKLNEFVGIFALNVDLGIGIKLKNNRDVAYAFLERRDLPKRCRLVKKTTTVKQATTTPLRNLHNKIKNKTPKIKKTSTLMPKTEKPWIPYNTCKYFEDQKFAEIYGCRCGPLSFYLFTIDWCCEDYHNCIEMVKGNNTDCPSLPSNLYYISINTSNYNWECDKCLESKNNKCQQAHCECDRRVAKCWAQFPVPTLNDQGGSLKIPENEKDITPAVALFYNCPIKWVEEAKFFSNVPIAKATIIRRIAYKTVHKVVDLIEAGKELEPETGSFLTSLLVLDDVSKDYLESFENIINTTLTEIVKQSKIALKKAEKTMDEKDWIDADTYFVEYAKVKLAAISFGKEYNEARKWLRYIIKLGRKIATKRVENYKKLNG